MSSAKILVKVLSLVIGLILVGMVMDAVAKLSNLKEKRRQLDACIQRLEACEKARERKRETRRKILVGAYHLEKARSDGCMQSLNRAMDGFLVRKSDRALFDLDEEADEFMYLDDEKAKIETT